MEVTWHSVDYLFFITDFTFQSWPKESNVAPTSWMRWFHSVAEHVLAASHCAHRKKHHLIWGTWTELLHCSMAVEQHFNSSISIHLISCILTEWKWLKVIDSDYPLNLLEIHGRTSGLNWRSVKQNYHTANKTVSTSICSLLELQWPDPDVWRPRCFS